MKMQQISTKAYGTVTGKNSLSSALTRTANPSQSIENNVHASDSFIHTGVKSAENKTISPGFGNALKISLAYSSGIKTVTDSVISLESSPSTVAMHGAGLACNTAMALIALNGLKEGIEKKDNIKKIHNTATLSTSILRTIGNAKQFGTAAEAVTEGQTSSIMKNIANTAKQAANLSKCLCLLSSGLFLTSGSILIHSGVKENNLKKLLMGGVDIATSVSAIGTLIPSCTLISRIALMGALTARIIVSNCMKS
ncbi:MAG: hypothetical protein AB9903_00810 [Vulcanimicrobiota bacterium]